MFPSNDPILQDVARNEKHAGLHASSYGHAANLQAWIEGQYERSILGLERLTLKHEDCPARCGRYLDISLDDWARART